MRKDPIVAKELGVQQQPDTGILLNKASIVQGKHTYWHEKMTGGGGSKDSNTCLDSDLGHRGCRMFVEIDTYTESSYWSLKAMIKGDVKVGHVGTSL